MKEKCEYYALWAHDYSANVCGKCIPKNAIYGRMSRNMWFIFSDYSSLNDKDPIIEIGVRSQNDGRVVWYKTRMNYETPIFRIIEKVMDDTGLSVDTVCSPVIRSRDLNKPELSKAPNSMYAKTYKRPKLDFNAPRMPKK